MVRKDSLIYRSGDAFIPEPIRSALFTYIVGGPHTLFYINYWSIIHFLSGIIFSFALRQLGIVETKQILGWALLVHTLWEIWQRAIGMTTWDLRGSIDTCVDTILLIGGVWIGM